jgi:hypothetical protein
MNAAELGTQREIADMSVSTWQSLGAVPVNDDLGKAV